MSSRGVRSSIRSARRYGWVISEDDGISWQKWNERDSWFLWLDMKEKFGAFVYRNGFEIFYWWPFECCWGRTDRRTLGCSESDRSYLASNTWPRDQSLLSYKSSLPSPLHVHWRIPMGNVHSGSALTRTTVALDSFVGELGGDIIFEKRWGMCHPLISHLNTKSLPQVWVQLDFWRRWNVAIGMDIWWLRYLLNQILGFLWEHIIEEWKVRERDKLNLFRILIFAPVEREALADIANVYNYQTFVETDKAGYIIRQWLASNLYDRIRFVVGYNFSLF